MDTYLITGGAGFIGSNFIKYLFEKECGIRIINMDKLTYAGNLDNLRAVTNNSNYIFLRGDICDNTQVNNIFKKYCPDYVINFAAESHVDRSINNSEDFIKTNVLGTQNLLQASLNYNIKRYIQISTDEVYGPSLNGECFNEEHPLSPSNPYAASKASADLLTLSFFKTHQLPVIITRCTNNYGQNQYEEKLIPLVIKHCLEGRKIPIYGDGKHVRDWLHVIDHCRAIHSVLKNGTKGEIYNISAANEMENITVIELIIKKLKVLLDSTDTRIKSIGESLIQFVEDRKGHDRKYSISSAKLRNELGWTPVESFSGAITETIKWYVDNGNWFYRKAVINSENTK